MRNLFKIFVCLMFLCELNAPTRWAQAAETATAGNVELQYIDIPKDIKVFTNPNNKVLYMNVVVRGYPARLIFPTEASYDSWNASRPLLNFASARTILHRSEKTGKIENANFTEFDSILTQAEKSTLCGTTIVRMEFSFDTTYIYLDISTSSTENSSLSSSPWCLNNNPEDIKNCDGICFYQSRGTTNAGRCSVRQVGEESHVPPRPGEPRPIYNCVCD